LLKENTKQSCDFFTNVKDQTLYAVLLGRGREWENCRNYFFKLHTFRFLVLYYPFWLQGVTSK